MYIQPYSIKQRRKMTLSEWRKKKDISHYTLGQMLGFKSLNPATNSQRYCLESKEKRFPRPDVVKKIIKVTEGEVTINDLYQAWWDYEKTK
ncbi:hypothetical protein HTVC034P_gp14 [Pelagibacter phage HTVC034P]|jgi:hypothetical protein|nr:hypothetical protein HTVC034P_gp14 [Pelagibacter phage HTVC034P]|tara:strand:+ start:147 stop:419 length:273 start_codon:yes stop_codon:yes gene_type:complete